MTECAASPSLNRHIQCPACGGDSARALTAQPLRTLGETSLSGVYGLLACDGCGLWFKYPLPTKGALDAHYGAMRAEGSAWNYGSRLPHERKIDSVLQVVPDGGKILDVGCWTGRLLAPHARRLRTFGIEPNHSAADIATAVGVEVLGTDADDLRNDRLFDVITMVDVFEHLLDPVGVVRRLVAALAPDGTLVVVSGRTDCTPVRLAGASYWYFGCADHLVFFNRRFANALGRMIPGTTVDFEPVRHFDFNWRQFGFELSWLLAWRFLSPHSPFPKPSLHRLPGAHRLARLKNPVVCGMWRDHAMLTLKCT